MYVGLHNSMGVKGIIILLLLVIVWVLILIHIQIVWDIILYLCCWCWKGPWCLLLQGSGLVPEDLNTQCHVPKDLNCDFRFYKNGLNIAITTPQYSRILLEELPLFQLVQKFPTFYETWQFITTFTRSHCLSVSWAMWTQSFHSISFLLRFIIIPSSRLGLGLPKRSHSFVLSGKSLTCVSVLSLSWHVPHASYHPWFDQLNNTWGPDVISAPYPQMPSACVLLYSNQ
jgi:hypothetical protein